MQIAIDSRGAGEGTRNRSGVAGTVEIFLDPLIVILTLVINAVVFDQNVNAQYIVLILIALSMTFPGSLRLTDSPGRMAIKTTTEWALVVVMLVLFGYFTGYLDQFPQSFVVSWILTTEICLIASH